MAARTERAIEAHRDKLVEELGSEGIRAIADDLFDALASHPLSDTTRGFSVQDFWVLGFEFWLTFRKTAFLRRAAGEMVDRLFEKYGRETAVAMLEDLGVDPARLLGEVKQFAGPIFALAEQTGFLEHSVRAVLTPFYASVEAHAVLGS